MTSQWRPGQEAGSALILAVLEAARVMSRELEANPYSPPIVGHLITASRMLDGAIAQLMPRPTWRATTWGMVAALGAGTRVRLGGHEAVVASAELQQWHVDPRSDQYRPRPLEHRVVAVRLGGGEKLYTMPPDGAVEVLDVEWSEESLAEWVAAAGAVLECQAVEELKRTLGAEGVDQ
jgi:hypothetical protein